MERLTGFEQFCLWGGAIIGGLGAIALFAGLYGSAGGWIFMGLVAAVSGVGMIINHFSKKKRVEEARYHIEREAEKKLKEGLKIIRAILAEVVDFRAKFKQKDAESQKVLDFLEQISPGKYVRSLSESNNDMSIAT
jgi:uncharacterized membrane protein